MAVEVRIQRKTYKDIELLERIRGGDSDAWSILIDRYIGFVKLKSSGYFMPGGDYNDLIQEGLIGFTKAVRDYRTDREASFRSFAELCVTRQIITAIKTGSRQKHQALNSYLSLNFSASNSGNDGECTLADILPASPLCQPEVQVMATEEMVALADKLCDHYLSDLEATVLLHYIHGLSYEDIAEKAGVDAKSVDNAMQRIKRKVDLHQEARRSFEELDIPRKRVTQKET